MAFILFLRVLAYATRGTRRKPSSPLIRPRIMPRLSRERFPALFHTEQFSPYMRFGAASFSDAPMLISSMRAWFCGAYITAIFVIAAIMHMGLDD